MGAKIFEFGAEVVAARGAVDHGIPALIHKKLLQGERRAHAVSGEPLARGRGARRDADGRIDGEPRVGPLDHTFRQPFVEKLAAQEEGDDSLTEARTHPGQIHRREVNEPTLAVEASLQEQSVPVGVPPHEFSRALEHKDCGAADGLSCGGR